MLACSYCDEPAIAALYIGAATFILTCADHYDEALEDHPISTAYTLDDEIELDITVLQAIAKSIESEE